MIHKPLHLRKEKENYGVHLTKMRNSSKLNLEQLIKNKILTNRNTTLMLLPEAAREAHGLVELLA